MFEAILIISCFILIIGLALLTYYGVFHKIEIKIGKPPIGEFIAFYKYRTGPYHECLAVFIELSNLVPSTVEKFGIYYSDPKVVEASKLKYAVGAAFPNEVVSSPQYEQFCNLLQNNGFKKVCFPKSDKAVIVEYPIRSKLSLYIAMKRVYKRLSQFMDENRLNIKAVLEYYMDNRMYFYIPLDNMDKFVVPEALQD